MSTITDLMNRSLVGVFNERDPRRRVGAAELTYTEDVVFHDPEGTARGRAAIVAKAGALLDASAGLAFTARGRAYESAGTLGLLAWRFGPPDGDPVATGIDIALISDGLIHTLHTVLDS